MHSGDFQAEAQTEANTIHFSAPCSITTIEALKCSLIQIGGNVIAGIFNSELKLVLFLH